MVRKTTTLVFALVAICGMALHAVSQEQTSIPKIRLKTYHPPAVISQEEASQLARNELNSPEPATTATSPVKLPHFSYDVTASRDGNKYAGIILGQRPFSNLTGTTKIPTMIIPVIVKTVALGVAVDSSGDIAVDTGNASDDTTFNPTVADKNCLASPNDVPATVVAQSPLFQVADFNYGGTDVGTTQTTDAHQRGSFWATINPKNYHVLLDPVTVLPAVTLKVAAPKNGVGGLALDLPAINPVFCGPEGLVDVNTINSFVVAQLKALSSKVGPTDIPLFIFYNTAFTIGDPTNLANCCAAGFHDAVNVGTKASPVFQTYAPFDFDMTGLFLNASGSPVSDIEDASHEVAELVNDPLGNNPTPAWGNVGQDVGTCQNNLEVGDPLTGLEAPRIRMPNGFTYNMQELAFFNWFFGAVNGGPASLGVNGWYSNNGTFLTDAGAICSAGATATF
jgi:hypothetical protein